MNAQAARDPRNQAAAQRPNDDPRNRLHLNFGVGETNFAADVGRAFPTTPSTFPQPMYANQYGQRETWGIQQAPAGFANNASYFMTNPYQPQYAQQGAAPTPGVAGYNAGPMSPGYDATNGLVHQLSQQHLGGSTPRSESPYGRQPSPAGRSRPDGRQAAQQQQQYGGQLGVPAHGQQPQQQQQQYATSAMEINEALPPKNPEKYSDNVFRRAKVSKELVGAFFRENVQRARDRNQR